MEYRLEDRGVLTLGQILGSDDPTTAAAVVAVASEEFDANERDDELGQTASMMTVSMLQLYGAPLPNPFALRGEA